MPVTVVHCCTHLRPLGGVQTILRRHLRRDREVGLDSAGLIFFERGPFSEAPPDTTVSGLGLHWYDSGRSLRRRFKKDPLVHLGKDQAWVYHDLWALPTLADLDPATLRIGLLHSHWVGAEDLLRRSEGLLDGILCVSSATVNLARDCLPRLARDRVRWIPYPVDSPVEFKPKLDGHRRELVLGYCGRIQRPQKRVERLPEITHQLKAAGIQHRWEFLGEGPATGSLAEEFRRVGIPALFHGVKTGSEYWRLLAEWDAIVFTSDYEGLPIALLEALSQGVVSVYPDLDNGGRDYTMKVASELIYSPANPSGAAHVIRWLSEQPQEVRSLLRLRARDAAAPHTEDAYGRTFSDFVSSIIQEPKVSVSGRAARRVHYGEWFPFGFLGRLNPQNALRLGYL